MRHIFALIIFFVAALPLSAADLELRNMESGDGNTAVINDGNTFFYGFDVIPTDPSVNLDEVAASGAGDFHGLSQPDYDKALGLAKNIENSGAEKLMRTDFSNSLWRAQFIDSQSWTIEARINILEPYDPNDEDFEGIKNIEGSEGVFGFYAGNNHGEKDIRIGTTFVRDDSTGVNIAEDMDNIGWHVWRIVKDSSIGYWVYRDGELINENPLVNNGSNNRSFAGDYSSTLSGDWEMDYYSLDPTGAYEPGWLQVIETDGTTEVTEAGDDDSYQINILAVPQYDVDIIITPDDQLDLGQGPGVAITVTFTSTSAQSFTVNVAAHADSDPEGPHSGVITHEISTVDPFFAAASIRDINVAITDNEPYCGDENTVYLASDLNKDCYVNVDDLLIIVDKWLTCSDPAVKQCYGNIPPRPIETSTVFTSGQEYASFRIPSVVVTQAGTVLAFCEGRVTASDHAQNDIVLKRSTNGGRTWGHIQVLHDDGANSLNNPQAIVVRQTGRIIMMYQRFPQGCHERCVVHGYEDSQAGQICRCYVIYSDDDGVTWSQPEEITRSVKRPSYVTSIAGGPGIGIQLRHGTHAGRIIMPFNQGPYGDWKVYSVYSDDQGETWAYGDVAPEIDGSGNEVQMVELSDSTIMLNSRTSEGLKFRKTAISSDGGITWTGLVNDTELMEPRCMGSVLRYTDDFDGIQHRMLYAGPDSQSSRVNGTVHISYDDGETWPTSRQIYAGSYAYSCLTRLADREIGVLYEADGYSRIVFARFSLKWLTRGEDWLTPL